MSASFKQCHLWMGNLEPYMDETFIKGAFRKMGEEPTLVRMVRNKLTGRPETYCFIHFGTEQQAIKALYKLKTKPIPDTEPIVRFYLKDGGYLYNGANLKGDFPIYVGNLSSEVDEYKMYSLFASNYNSVKCAKVERDDAGVSKGYGFVGFGLEAEQMSALNKMQDYVGLGTMRLKVRYAAPKKSKAVPQETTDYGQLG